MIVLFGLLPVVAAVQVVALLAMAQEGFEAWQSKVVASCVVAEAAFCFSWRTRWRRCSLQNDFLRREVL